MMDFAVAIFLAVVATVVASVIFGKELDEKERDSIGKDEIKGQEEK